MRAFLPRLFLIIGASGLLLQIGCGGCDDDDDIVIDARITPDAEEIDAEVIDAMPTTTHAGTVSVLDMRVRFTNAATFNGNAAGHGGFINASFPALLGAPGVVDAPGEIYDDRNSIGLGCAASVYDLTMGEAPPPDENHGTVAITGSTQTVPPCAFVGTDYLCIGDVIASVGTGAIGMGAAATLTVTGHDFSGSEGRWVSISGAGIENFRNLGTFQILGVTNSDQTLLFYNPAAVDDGSIAGATVTVISGAGPIPDDGPTPPPAGLPDPPEFIADDDDVTVELTAPNGDPFVNFSTEIAAGSTFATTQATDDIMRTTPIDGSELVFSVADVLTHTGVGPTLSAGAGPLAGLCLLTHAGAGFRAARLRSTVTIAGTTGGDGTHMVFGGVSADTLAYIDLGGCVTEAFVAGSSYTLDDTGDATDPLSVVSMDFNNGALYKVVSGASGVGPVIDDDGADCILTHTGEFLEGMAATSVAAGPEMFVHIEGASNAGNNGDFRILDSDADSLIIELDLADCTDENFAAGVSYEVRQSLVYSPTTMADPATTGATKVGTVFCSALADNITVPAAASDAIDQVMTGATGLHRVRSVFVRANFDQIADLNPSNVAVGHAVIGFSTVTVP